MVDIAALLGEQPLIDEDGGDDGLDTNLDTESHGENMAGDEPPAAGDPPPSRNQKVPLAALHEERTKRQQFETDLQTERQRSQALQDRFNQFLMDQQTQQAPQQQQEQTPPNFVDDPEGAFNHLQRQLAAAQQQMQQYVQGQTSHSQAQQQHQQLAQVVSAQEADYTKSVPDYPQAADFFYNLKVKEYSAFVPEMQAKQQVAQDYTRIAQLAQQMGKNPAELMYTAARNMGYVPGSQQQRKAPNTSLSNVGGSPRAPDEKGNITAADIADMTEAEFDKYWAGIKRGSVVGPKI